ncbi:MAG TPA: NADH-quinone oxidoreductase subunit N [Candidatus Polarisedimenticolia bacterium]|nr:NADH-quinone oxidoreductase subunit N [Candidatus Polarisedimenticolia bacterium]
MIESVPESLARLAPLTILAAWAVLALLLVTLFRRLDKATGYLTFMGILLAGVSAFRLLRDGAAASLFSGALLVDRFSLLFTLLFLATAGLTVLTSIPLVEQEGKGKGEYYVLILTAAIGMILMASSENLLTIFLGLEILSISLYILAGFTRDVEKSVEASMKYFLLGAFATAFILYGAALLFGVTRSIELRGIARAFALPAESAIDPRAMAGMGLLLVGLAFKLGAAPFHFWIPDVYQGSPTPVAGFMAAGTKAAALATILRLFGVAFRGPSVEAGWIAALSLMAACTMIVGNVVALAQTNVKRMLGYSSIAHAGYLLVGVVVTSAVESRQAALSAIVYYLAGYIFMNLGAFAVASVIGRTSGGAEEGYSFENYSGLARRRPFLAAVMTMFMLSLTGIPPMAGFLGKFFLFRVAIDGRFYFLAVLGVLNSVVGAFYYLRVVVHMHMKEPSAAGIPPGPTSPEGISLAFAAAATLFLGLFPGWLLDLSRSLL